MTFNETFKVIKVSKDRIGAIVGKKGSVKSEIELKCNVRLDIDGESGDVSIDLKKTMIVRLLMLEFLRLLK